MGPRSLYHRTNRPSSEKAVRSAEGEKSRPCVKEKMGRRTLVREPLGTKRRRWGERDLEMARSGSTKGKISCS